MTSLKYALLLFDWDGCTDVIESQRLKTEGPVVQSVQTELRWGHKIHKVEVLEVGDSTETLDQFEGAWSSTQRALALDEAKKTGRKGGFLSVWPADSETETEVAGREQLKKQIEAKRKIQREKGGQLEEHRIQDLNKSTHQERPAQRRNVPEPIRDKAHGKRQVPNQTQRSQQPKTQTKRRRVQRKNTNDKNEQEQAEEEGQNSQVTAVATSSKEGSNGRKINVLYQGSGDYTQEIQEPQRSPNHVADLNTDEVDVLIQQLQDYTSGKKSNSTQTTSVLVFDDEAELKEAVRTVNTKDMATQCDPAILKCDCQSIVVKKLEAILDKISAKEDRDSFQHLFACTSNDDYGDMSDAENPSGLSFMSSEPAVEVKQTSVNQKISQPLEAEIQTSVIYISTPSATETQIKTSSSQVTSQPLEAEIPTSAMYISPPSATETQIKTSSSQVTSQPLEAEIQTSDIYISSPSATETQIKRNSTQVTSQPLEADMQTSANSAVYISSPSTTDTQIKTSSPQAISQQKEPEMQTSMTTQQTVADSSRTPSPSETSEDLTQAICQSVASNWAQISTNLSQNNWITSPNPTTMPTQVFQDQTIFIPKISSSKSKRRKSVFSPCSTGAVVEVMSPDDMGHVPENAEVRIKPQLVRSCQQMSCSKGNFAWTLAKSLYKKGEMEGRNFSGGNKKLPMSPRRVHAITHAMDDVYGPGEDNIPAARDAINSGLRSYKYHDRPLRTIQNFMA